MTQTINQPVTVTAVHFTQQFDMVPKRLEFDGVSYDLNDAYTKTLLETDEGLTELIDVSDGTRQFHLRHGQTTSWQLLRISL